MAQLEITALQPQLVASFARIIAAGQLSAAYVFAGPAGTGKHELAVWLAQRLFCTDLQDGMPCGHCAECQRVLSGNHPDLVTLKTDTRSLKVDDIRGMKEEMSKSGMEGNTRVFIIDDAEKMTAGAANSLLKFYEEPVPGMTIILTTTAKNQLLPTILSRAQVINFPAPKRATVIAQLTAAGTAAPLAKVAAHLAADVTTATALTADDALQQQVDKVLALLGKVASGDEEAFVMVQTSLVPLAKTLPAQQQLLALIAQALADALDLHYGVQTDLAFGEAPAVQALAKRSADQLTANLTAALTAQVRLAANVIFQADVEALVLQIL